MSHFTTIQTQIRDLEALRDACGELSLGFTANARCRGWRKGRFDEMFFVDLPDALERAQIWDIVIKRHGRRPTDFDTVVLARACKQFTGAEIEAAFIDAMHESYFEGEEPNRKHLLEAISSTVPLANLMDGQIAALRHWPRAAPAKPPAAARPPATAGGSRRRINSPHLRRYRPVTDRMVSHGAPFRHSHRTTSCHLEPENANDNEAEAYQTRRGSRIPQKYDTAQHCPHSSNSRPNGVGSTNRN